MASHLEASVSKGVFAFKGKRKHAKPESYYSESDKASSEERYRIYGALWDDVSDRVQALQSDLNTKIFDDLLDFIRLSHKPKANENTKILSEIPTAAIITGVNSPDHAVMLSNFVNVLQEKVTPFVCQLRSKDCATVRATVSKAVALLMEAPSVLDEEDDEQPNMKRINPTFSVLAQWYKDKLQQSKSPSRKNLSSSPLKRRASECKTPEQSKSPSKVLRSSKLDIKSPPKVTRQVEQSSLAGNDAAGDRSADNASSKQVESGKKHPVVFIIPDLESFAPHVLQDFVTICSNHLEELPIVLVFGIATSVTTVHRLLPHAASSHLSMEKFQAPPSSEYLTSVINKVLMTSELPFKLGPRVFSFLLDMFLFHDFSVMNFVRGLQFALLDHFYSHPYSVLCQVDTSDSSEDKLTNSQLQYVLTLASFNSFVESNLENYGHLRTDMKALKDLLPQLLQNIRDYHSCYFPVLQCLHVFAGKLPGYPIGKQIREMYALNLEGPIFDNPKYAMALTLMKSLSRDELILNLKTCQELLHCDALPDEFNGIQTELQELINKFENIEELQLQADLKQKEAESEAVELPKKTDMYTLRQKLQEMEKKKKKLSVYEELRNDTIDYLDSVFRKYLLCPNELPLHEAFYYDDVSAIRRTINGSPRATIQAALSDPYQYLQNAALEAPEDGSISPDLPDICIAFKLHLECGRLINLYDWLQAFMMIVASNKEVSAKKTKSRMAKETNETRVIQARFIRAVSELQFLGFLKPTKRKTDHVSRLTWGGC